MQQSFIAALSNAQAAVPSYVQAVNSIQQYCSWIINQSVPDQKLNNILQKLRADAGTWYNSIYPQYLNMPEAFLTAGTTINSDLTILISLANQEQQSGTTPALQQEVTQYANSLISTLQGLLSQVNALSAALNTFQQQLQQDAATINQTVYELQNQMAALQNQLSQLYGELHSLQSATCPNSGDIQGCENAINQTQNQLNQTQSELSIFYEAGNLIQGAILGAQYLSRYWLSVGADVQNCIQALQGVSNESGQILALDLTGAQSRWNALQNNFAQINSQVNK